jgi:hypothetical protein
LGGHIFSPPIASGLPPPLFPRRATCALTPPFFFACPLPFSPTPLPLYDPLYTLLQREREDKLRKERQAQEADAAAAEAAERQRQDAIRKIEEDRAKEQMEQLLARAKEAQMDVAKLAAQHLDRAALQRAVNERLQRARDDENRRRVEQGRRVDYLVRALRETERPKVEALLKATLDGQKSYVAKHNEDQLTAKRATFDAATAVKGKISKLVPFVEEFEKQLMKRREAAFEVIRVSAGNCPFRPKRAVFVLFVYPPRSSRRSLYPPDVPNKRAPAVPRVRRPHGAHSIGGAVPARGRPFGFLGTIGRKVSFHSSALYQPEAHSPHRLRRWSCAACARVF